MYFFFVQQRVPFVSLLFWIFLQVASVASAGTRVSLNDNWQFARDPAGSGEKLGWMNQPPDSTESVTVPHTWNLGPHEDYEGTAWYFKVLTLPDEFRAKHVELHFGATFYRSRVWINGVELGQHEGGHTAYFFDLTSHLEPSNFLAVAINNQPGLATIPGWSMKLWEGKNTWYDWWHYGGIVRDVWLQINEPAMIRRQLLRVKVDGNLATVTDHLFLENSARKPIAGRILLKVYPDSGEAEAARFEKGVVLHPGQQELTAALRIEKPLLWHFDHPNLYRLEAMLFDARGAQVDSATDQFGCRILEIRNRHLYLNGELVRLTGMTRHEDSPWEGLAETAGTIRHDYDEMKDLQVTLTRPVHYPQHPAILDYCDRRGILLIPEIPIWQFSEKQLQDPKLVTLAQHIMQEMVQQDYNHPSIFAWSVCNESATDTAGGRSYFKTMYEMLKSLDPDRFVSYADDRIAFVDNPFENAASQADFIMMNQYFGTWHGAASELEPRLEAVGKKYSDKMVIISEFGAAGFFAPDSEQGDEIRSHIIRDQLRIFGKFDWIGGAIFWCYQDYKSHRNLWPGLTQGYVEMGVVNENRQRRPSYAVWKDENAPARLMVEWKNGSTSPVGFQAIVSRRSQGEIPSYELRGYRLTWDVRDSGDRIVNSGDKVLPELGPDQTVEASWVDASSRSLKLSVHLIRPTGFIAAEKKLLWWDPRSGGLDIDAMRKQGKSVPPGN
ncbi:MAG TPA: glycoside hydrolase family 2 TIM barrel-domain containing protein [Terriglobia bacterium]|nr:glycoside hydrolase family 2 TIM barrel-domain containing protein [Terriglobia bacterium]